MSECIRRPGSQWTLCPCQDCRTAMRRQAKRHRNGIAAADQRPAARQRLHEWAANGYSVGVVAAMTGLRKATLARHLRDDTTAISHATARKIMAATPRPDSGGFVSSIGTSRRLRALTVMGWSMHDLSQRCGIGESTLHGLRDPGHRWTRPRYADAIAALYDELAMVQGNNRSAGVRAARKGWLAPLAWDDIDDPAEDPTATVADDDEVDEVVVQRLTEGANVTATRDERLEAVRRLTASGLTDQTIATMLGVTVRTVLRWRAEFGIESRRAA